VLNIFVFVEVAATCLAVGHSCWSKNEDRFMKYN
jgi:hypothetical protein